MSLLSELTWLRCLETIIGGLPPPVVAAIRCNTQSNRRHIAVALEVRTQYSSGAAAMQRQMGLPNRAEASYSVCQCSPQSWRTAAQRVSTKLTIGPNRPWHLLPSHFRLWGKSEQLKNVDARFACVMVMQQPAM